MILVEDVQKHISTDREELENIRETEAALRSALQCIRDGLCRCPVDVDITVPRLCGACWPDEVAAYALDNY